MFVAVERRSAPPRLVARFGNARVVLGGFRAALVVPVAMAAPGAVITAAGVRGGRRTEVPEGATEVTV